MIPVLKVEWIDSAGGSGWEFLEDYKSEAVHVTTYGFLIREDEETISVAQSYAPGTVKGREQINNDITIPKCAISSVCVLPSSYPEPALKQPLQGFSLVSLLSDHGEPQYIDETAGTLQAGEKQKEQKPAEWSPTKEQMVALSWAANGMLDSDSPSAGDIKASLRTLYNDLQSKSIMPAEWSEEDKSFYDSIICEVIKEGMHPTPEQAKWFKSLPERFNLQPKQEWSEDEERLIKTSISFLKDFADKGYENAVECIDWLKSKLNGNTCK